MAINVEQDIEAIKQAGGGDNDILNYLKENGVSYQEQSSGEKPQESMRGSIFGKVSESDYQSGERNILGNIFERPGAAVRASIQAPFGEKMEAYKKGSINPTGVPKFQDIFLDKYYGSIPGEFAETPPIRNLGMGVSAAGLAADIVSEPANVLSTMFGMSPQAKATGQFVSSTKLGQAFGRFMNRERSVTDITKSVLEKTPKIMNDNWVIGQAKLGQTVTEGIDDSLHNAYNRVYKDVKNFGVNSDEIDKILLDSLDEAGLADVQRSMMSAFGSDKIDTIEKAHFLNQVLSKRTPSSLYRPSVAQGKGGQANVKIRQISTKKAIKNIISDSIEQVDPELAIKLKDLDNFASEKIYPTLEKMRGIFGEGEIPKTEGIMNVYPLRALGSASQRKTIKDVPGLSKEMKKYISEDYVNDLKELDKNSIKLLKQMRSFRKRQLIKGAGTLYLLNKGREQIMGNQ